MESARRAKREGRLGENYYRTLRDQLDVQVADPCETKAIGTAEVKNDRLDAKLLAQLCRADMIAESYVPENNLVGGYGG